MNNCYICGKKTKSDAITPCKKCAADMKLGILLISVDLEGGIISPPRTGQRAIVSKDAIFTHVLDEKQASNIIASGFALIDSKGWGRFNFAGGK